MNCPINRTTLKGKHIVLGICGGIAAYKTITLLRLLIKGGAEVQVVITPAGKEFVTPVTLSALSQKPVVSEFFSANTGEWHSHVDLGLWADLMVIAPATASTIGKMANGIADNMLVTTYLSAKEHIMIAPAMDLDMYKHPTTRRNLNTLVSDGVEVIEAASGELASGLTGKGRMAEPEEIYRRIESFFMRNSAKKGDLNGKRILITAGPTYEKIDPVRFIGNYSSGKMGIALAESFASRGADVVLICGPVSVSIDNPKIKRIDVESAVEMRDVSLEHISQCDVAVFAAAVADYRPEHYSDQKIKREKDEMQELRLVRNPDIAAECGKLKKEGQTFICFALETDNGIESARKKMKAKNADMVVLNSLQDSGAGFKTDTNVVTLVKEDGEIKLPLMSKKDVAERIVDSLKLVKREEVEAYQ